MSTVTPPAEWDQHAPTYDVRQREPTYMACIDAVVRELDVKPGDTVLDAACGTGLTIRQYLRPDVKVTAVDISRGMLDRLPQGPHAVRASIVHVPLRSGIYDKVVCANALQHLRAVEERQRSVQELARV